MMQMPEVSSCFSDLDEMMDLLESLEPRELSIIVRSKDPQILLKVKKRVEDDMNDTAKQLAMEE
jgi:hypothetical protein